MADPFSDFMNWMSTGSNAFIPLFIIAIIVVVYLIATKKAGPKIKEFKELDLKKETRRRYNQQYKFFGIESKKNIYAPNGRDNEGKVTYEKKPFGYVQGYIKDVWFDQLKRYEPVRPNYSKEQFAEKLANAALEVYQKPYEALDDEKKKNIHQLAKEELRDETASNAGVKLVRGKKEIVENRPTPVYKLRISKPSFLWKLLSALLGVGTNWFVYSATQLTFEDDRILLNADYQKKTYNDVFIFSKAGENLVEDIGFAIERENIWQATANQIPRTVHFDMEAAKSIIYKREDAKIQDEHYKHQKEGNE